MSFVGPLFSASLNAAHTLASRSVRSMSDALTGLFRNLNLAGTEEGPQRKVNGRPSIAYFDALRDSTGFPAELLVEILDYAGVWLSAGQTDWPSTLSIRVHNGKTLVSQSPQLSLHGVRSLRRVFFRVTSKDQGWSSEGTHFHGTYNASYTWHEARVQGPDEPERTAIKTFDTSNTVELQRNRHAGRRFESYCIEKDVHELDIDSALVEGAKISLYACARFPGWTNEVSFASIELQFADHFEEQAPDPFLL